MTAEQDILVVYDKECPVCDYYCRRIDVAEDRGHMQLVDARENSDVMNEVTALGLDIDEGMVVKDGDTLYYGAEAIHELALLSSKKGFINRCAAAAFRSRRMARVLYPVLKACRNLLLKLLGRTRINNLDRPGQDRF